MGRSFQSLTKCFHMRISYRACSFFFCSLCLLNNAFAGKDDLKKFDSIVNAIDICAFTKATKANLLTKELQRISMMHPDNLYFSAQTLHWQARINYLQNISDSALTGKVLAAVNTWNTDDHPFEKALLDRTLALCYTVDGDFANAFKIALKAFGEFEAMNDTASMSNALNLLGNICGKTQNRNMAIDYYRKAFALTKPSERRYYSTFIVLYTNLSYISKEKEPAIDSLISIIPVLEKQKDTSDLITVCFNLGTRLMSGGNTEKGKFYYFKGEKYAEECHMDNLLFTSMSCYNMGAMLLAEGNLSAALQNAYGAQTAAISSKNSEQLSRAWVLLSEIYAKRGNNDSSYHYLRKYSLLQNKLMDKAKMIEVYQEYISMSLESAKKELTIAQQNVLLRNKQFIIFIIIAISIIIMITLFLIVVQQQKRNINQQNLLKETENKELANRLQHEKRIKTLQEEKYKLEQEKQHQQLESKAREITSYSLLLTNKNEVLQHISEVAKQLANHSGQSNEIYQKINDIVRNNISIDTNWSEFVAHFDKVHPKFFDTLKAICPDLTEHSLRMCAYFRMGISSKQMAQMLNVAPSNIKQIRYRLKKRFNLSENENLDDFLRSI